MTSVLVIAPNVEEQDIITAYLMENVVKSTFSISHFKYD